MLVSISIYADSSTTRKNLQHHVAYLSSNKLEGRLTGSPGEQLATQYVADQFFQLGLEPAGDNDTFFQEFTFTAGASLGKNNSLSIIYNNKKKQLTLNETWRPLSFSDNTSFETSKIIFVGYGITAPAIDNLPAYDSYHKVNAKNKWVVVFNNIPKNISEKMRDQISPYASLRYKAFTAKEHGAKGIIIVDQINALTPLSSDTSSSESGIIALSVSNTVIDDLIRHNSPHINSLNKLQHAFDSGQIHSFTLPGVFKFSGNTDIEKNVQHGRNVLAILKVASTTSPFIVVGAHIDHLGHGTLSGSRARDNEVNMIHPGADDNASGVASVIETAATLSALKKQGKLHGDKNILFAAWSGEELGNLGSSHFVNHLQKNSTIEAAINLDMIGHLNNKLIVQGLGSSTAWKKQLNNIKLSHHISLITQNDPYLPTDSTAFYLHDIPSLNFFTGAHDDYHTPRDTADTLNYSGLEKISELLQGLIIELEANSRSIKFSQFKKPSHNTEQDLTIYLGTIPDYTSSDISGVKLSGVAKNSPAERAGLKQNDVIIKLANKSIHDIYDYSFVLNSLAIGKPTPILITRGKEKVSLLIVARYRES